METKLSKTLIAFLNKFQKEIEKGLHVYGYKAIHLSTKDLKNFHDILEEIKNFFSEKEIRCEFTPSDNFISFCWVVPANIARKDAFENTQGTNVTEKLSYFKKYETHERPNKQIPRDVCLVRFGIG